MLGHQQLGALQRKDGEEAVVDKGEGRDPLTVRHIGHEFRPVAGRYGGHFPCS